MMYQLRTLGLIDNSEREDFKQGKPVQYWDTFMQAFVSAKDNSEDTLAQAVADKLGLDANSEQGQSILKGMKWMGLFSHTAMSTKGTLLDALSDQLLSKMQYNAGERDMIFLQHNFEIENKDGSKQTRIATLLCYGDKDENGFSSMAKTTGLPCAVSTQLILDGEITHKGVFGPMFLEMNNKIEALLAKEGIVVEDQVINH